MKTRSILSAAIGSVFFACAIMMLIPTLASATFQSAGSPPRVSQAPLTAGKYLSAQQMKATKGASGYICQGSCYTGGGTGINGCGPSTLYGGCTCWSIYYNHSICVPDNNWGGVYSYCGNNSYVDCYDYQYWSTGCQTGVPYPTATHFKWCCA